MVEANTLKDTLVKVKVVSETDKILVYRHPNNSQDSFAPLGMDTGKLFYNTWREAWNCMLDRAHDRVKDAQNQLDITQSDYLKVVKMRHTHNYVGI